MAASGHERRTGDGPVAESVSVRPAAALAAFVAGYTGYRYSGLAAGGHRGLPSPYLTVIFTWDEPLVIAAHPDPRQPPASYSSVVGGLHTAPALISYTGSMAGIQVYLSPLGSRVLLGVPAGELAGLDVPAGDVLGPLAGQVGDRLRAADSWPERFAAVNQALLGRLHTAANTGPAYPEVTWAWRHLVRTGGRASVSELARASGWSDRHLRARFGSEIGLGPKAAGRVIRFHRGRQELQRRVLSGRTAALAELAVRCGYYDQAHLDRDFRQLAGLSPTGWLASEFRFVQATPGGQVAG